MRRASTFICGIAEQFCSVLFFSPPSMLIITEPTQMHDPERKTTPGGSPIAALGPSSRPPGESSATSPRSSATHTRQERVDSVPPSLERHPLGRWLSAPASRTCDAWEKNSRKTTHKNKKRLNSERKKNLSSNQELGGSYITTNREKDLKKKNYLSHFSHTLVCIDFFSRKETSVILKNVCHNAW